MFDDPRILTTRRQWTLGLLATALPLFSGCATGPQGFGRINLNEFAPDQVLVVGRMYIEWLEMDRTGDTWVDLTDGDERVLPVGGKIAWLIYRRRYPVAISGMRLARGYLAFGRGPVLAPASVPAAIVYFGTISVALSARGRSRVAERPSHVDIRVRDEGPATMAAFIRENPGLAGRRYLHLLQRKELTAPPAPAAPIPQQA